MMDDLKRKRGRPRGKADLVMTMLALPRDASEALTALSTEQRLSKSQVVRDLILRALRERENL